MIIHLQPWIDEEEATLMKKVLDSTFISENQMTKQFEKLTAEYTGARHCIAVNNGTIALYVALLALEIGPGDEVIIPDMTFIASANAVIMTGAKPVFCDVEVDSLHLDFEKAARLVNKNTKAIMPVHLYGYSMDMDKVMDFASAHKLLVVEDSAEGIGVRFKGRHVGTFGEVGTISYYANKSITCGEGGVVLTNNDELAKKVYRLKNHGRDVKGIFVHEHIGFNFCFTDMQAAIGVAQMGKLERIITRRKHVYNRYAQELKDVQHVQTISAHKDSDPAYWLCCFMVDDAEPLANYLHEKGVQTRRFFYPMHLQPCYKDMRLDPKDFAVSAQLFKKGITLPSAYLLTDEEQGYIIEQIRRYYEDRH